MAETELRALKRYRMETYQLDSGIDQTVTLSHPII